MTTPSRFILSIGLTSLCCLASAVQAESYIGAMFGAAEYSSDAVAGEFDQSTASLRIGTHASHYFAGELRYGQGTDGEEEAELDYYYGAYFRGITPTGTFFEPYFSLGYTRATMETSLPDESRYRISAWAWGLGADFDVTNKFKISLDFLRAFDHDNDRLDGLSVGFSYVYGEPAKAGFDRRNPYNTAY